jgi:hypothetical protein
MSFTYYGGRIIEAGGLVITASERQINDCARRRRMGRGAWKTHKNAWTATAQGNLGNG